MGMKWERWAPANGVLFVIAFIIAFVVAGTPPKVDEGAAVLREYYADDGAILTSTYFIGIALFLWISFIGTLAHRLREAGEARLAAVAFGGGIVLAAMYMAGAVANATLAYRTPAEDGILQTIYDMQLVAFNLTAFPSAALVAAVALAAWRTGLFPQWYNALAGLAVIGFLVGGATWASDGFFAPGGTYGLIMTFAFLAWTVVASGILTMQSAETAPRPATAM